MTIDKLDVEDVYSQDNKEYKIISKINEIIKEQNQIGKIIDDKIIYHTSHIDDDITEIEHKLNQIEELIDELTKPIEDLEDARCKCKKEPQFAPNNDDDTFIIMKTDQLRHMINTLTLLIDELINNDIH